MAHWLTWLQHRAPALVPNAVYCAASSLRCLSTQPPPPPDNDDLTQLHEAAGLRIRRRSSMFGQPRKRESRSMPKQPTLDTNVPDRLPVTRFTVLRCTEGVEELKAFYSAAIAPAYKNCAGFLGAQLLVEHGGTGAPRCAAISTWRDNAALAAAQEDVEYRQAMVELTRLVEPSTVTTEFWESAAVTPPRDDRVGATVALRTQEQVRVVRREASPSASTSAADDVN